MKHHNKRHWHKTKRSLNAPQELFSIPICTKPINPPHPLEQFAQFSSHGKYLFTYSQDYTGIADSSVWDIKTHSKIINPPENYLPFVSSNDDRLLTISTKHCVSVWDLEKRQELYKIEDPESWHSKLFFSPDGKFLMIESGKEYPQSYVKVIDINTRQGILRWDFPAPWATVQLSHNGKFLLALGYRGDQIRIWDLEARREISPFFHLKEGTQYCLYNSSKLLIATQSDSEITVWNLEKQKEIFSIKGDWRGYSCLFSNNAQFLAAIKMDTWADNKIFIWNLTTGKELLSSLNCSNDIQDFSFACDDALLITRSARQTQIWNTATGREQFTITGHQTRLWWTEFSTNNKLATASSDLIKIWNTSTGEELFAIRDNTAKIRRLSFSPNSRFLVAQSEGLPRVWDVSTGKELFTNTSKKNRPVAVAFSNDDTLIATTSHRQIKIWQAPKPASSSSPFS